VNTPALIYKYFKANINPRSIFIQHSDKGCHFSPLGKVRRKRKRVTKDENGREVDVLQLPHHLVMFRLKRICDFVIIICYKSARPFNYQGLLGHCVFNEGF